MYAVEIFNYISPECVPKICNGYHVHNQSLWREFFVTLELFRNQCISCGQDLIATMNEIRLTDDMAVSSKRQLHSQHRSLSRALMDSELQCLRRKGQITLSRLHNLAKSISNTESSSSTINCREVSGNDNSNNFGNTNRHVFHRLDEVTAIYEEVDRAARKLEELTDQRREYLREITRQKVLDEEIKEVCHCHIYPVE